MQEIDQIWLKYEESDLLRRLDSLEDVNRLALTFGKDLARTFRLITLLRDPGGYPRGYDLTDAPIVGLLTRVAKLFRLVCRFYELGNSEYLSIFSRPLIESAIVANYLLRSGAEVVEDFRRCSYKDTLRILRDHESGAEFFQTPAGRRVLQSAFDYLAVERLSQDGFGAQKRNRWRLQGESLYEICREIVGPDAYPFVYGMMSESLHGSWNDSMDWCLSRNENGSFSAFALFVGVDARAMLPLVRYATPAYALWIERTRPWEESVRQTLGRIQDYFDTIYSKFDQLYDGPTVDRSETAESTRSPRSQDEPSYSLGTAEIQTILAKYERGEHLARLLASTPEADRLALAFYRDVGEILDILTRTKNVERNPAGFSIDDAPILGLLVRTWHS